MVSRRRCVTVLAAGLFWNVLSADAQLVSTDSIPGAFMDISTVGTVLPLGDDGVAEVWPEFDLTQTLFSGGGGRVWISNNGALGFLVDGGFGAFALNTAIPSLGLFGGGHGFPQALAVYWDDLDSDTGAVYCATLGDPGHRVFIVQWQDRPHYPGDAVLDGDEVTFQVQVYEGDGPIAAQFLYADVDFLNPALNGGASATVGYQGGDEGPHVPWSFNLAGAVSAGTAVTLLNLPGPCADAGDSDGDCDIDRNDLEVLGVCMRGPGEATWDGCQCHDFDTNNRVDLMDVAAFQRAYTGEGETLPGCGS